MEHTIETLNRLEHCTTIETFQCISTWADDAAYALQEADGQYVSDGPEAQHWHHAAEVALIEMFLHLRHCSDDTGTLLSRALTKAYGISTHLTEHPE